MNRRSFLSLLGLAPVAPAVAALPASAGIAGGKPVVFGHVTNMPMAVRDIGKLSFTVRPFQLKEIIMAKKPTVAAEEQAVRDAACALFDAIQAAEQAGYRVYWPTAHHQLPTISVSETAKVERTRVIPVVETDKA